MPENTNPINVENSVCNVDPKLKTRLVKSYGAENDVKYFFKLCCPQVLKLTNKCTDEVSLIIPKCFEIFSTSIIV